MSLSQKKVRAVEALLEMPTIQAAADHCGLNRRTVERWLGDADFKRAYDGARQAAFDRTLARLQTVSSQALDVLVNIMQNSKAKPAAKIRAAAIVLRLAVDVQMADVLDKLDEIERSIADMRNEEGVRP